MLIKGEKFLPPPYAAYQGAGVGCGGGGGQTDQTVGREFLHFKSAAALKSRTVSAGAADKRGSAGTRDSHVSDCVGILSFLLAFFPLWLGIP